VCALHTCKLRGGLDLEDVVLFEDLKARMLNSVYPVMCVPGTVGLLFL